MHCVAAGLSAGHPFKEAELSDLQLSAAAISELGLALTTAGALARLSLSDCSLGDDGVSSVLPVVRTGSLTTLELRSNRIGNHGAGVLAEALAGNHTLLVLDLQRNEITCQGAIGLAAALQVNRTLRVLNVRFNEISDSGASALGKALQANKSVAELHLGGNLVGPEGAVHLAAALESNETVRTLNLRSNAILDVGAVAIARMCKRNDTLVELYLGSNGISEEGCAALADSWRSNTRLQKVDLQGAAAGRTGALAIAEALKVNRTLKQLVVEIETGNKEGASAVANALRSNTTITELALGESGALDEGVLAAVNGTLRVNKFITTIGNGGGNGSSGQELAEVAATPSANGGSATLSQPPPSQPPPVSAASPRTSGPLQTPAPLSGSSGGGFPTGGQSPQRPPSRSPTISRQPSLGASLGVSQTPASSSASPRGLTKTGSSGYGQPVSSVARAGQKQAAERVAASRQDGAITGVNTRLEQLAAAMEVRLQAQEAQVMRLASDLQTEREHGKMLEGQLAEVHAKLASSAAETERLKEELAEKGRNDAQLRQEVRWIDEASAKARAQEEEERRSADAALHEQIRALSEAQERLALDADSNARGASDMLGETQKALAKGLAETNDKLAALERSARSDAESIRSELSQQAASREAEVAEIAEVQAAASQKLSDELRWVDEEHMRCRAEDESKVGASISTLRSELSGSLAELKAQVAEAIVPPGEPGALSTLREALSRVDTLGEAVAQLCEYMHSLKVKEVAAAAEMRISNLEGRLAGGGGGAPSQQLEGRLSAVEAALAQEQHSSLRALQAILEHSGGEAQ